MRRDKENDNDTQQGSSQEIRNTGGLIYMRDKSGKIGNSWDQSGVKHENTGTKLTNKDTQKPKCSQ